MSFATENTEITEEDKNFFSVFKTTFLSVSSVTSVALRILYQEAPVSEIKKLYKTIMADNFPPEMTITFGDQKLIY
jgi:hypothetical protein